MAISLRLPKEVEARLDFLAQQTGRTKAFYLRSIIESNLDDLEDYYLASDVLERIRAGKEKTYSLAEMEKLVGLDD